MDYTDGNSSLASLKQKSEEMRKRGGLEKVQQRLNDLETLCQKNTDILENCERMINDEEKSDDKLRSKFGNKWTRVSSARLNEPLKLTLKKHKDVLNNAKTADRVVRERYQNHKHRIAKMHHLQGSNNELQGRNYDGCAEEDSALNDLSSVLDIYNDLLQKLEDGCTFYDNFTKVLINLQNKIENFCFARKIERDEMCKALKKNVATSKEDRPNTRDENISSDESSEDESFEDKNGDENSDRGENFYKENQNASKDNGEKRNIIPEDKTEKEMPMSKGVRRLVQDFKSLFSSECGSNVVLKVGNRTFKVHRDILIARSPVFASMLLHDTKENATREVDIPDCTEEAFEIFLSYIYTGSADNMSCDNILDLYYAADKYQMNELKTECVEYIERNLSTENLCAVMTLSLQHCESGLQQKAVQFFCNNFKTIIKTSDWIKYVQQYPVQSNELIIKATNA